MTYKLNSDKLSVSINSKGAEISSVNAYGVEYMWYAKSEVWPRHAPVLFPIVGKLKSGSMPQHGFARDKEFSCVSQNDAEIIFGLKSDENTRKIFPYEFHLKIRYTLNSDVITCSYEVNNPSSGSLFFSIGAHPGFATPDGVENYVLKFETDKNYEITLLKEGLLSDVKEKFNVQAGKVNLTPSLFDKDALVFENSQIGLLELICTKTGRGVELVCKDWPYFGIWTKKGCKEFICLEPWHGITDSINASGDLSQKKGIIKLETGKKFECSFSMRFF